MSKSTKGFGIFFIAILTVAIICLSVVSAINLTTYLDAKNQAVEIEQESSNQQEDNNGASKLGIAIVQAVSFGILMVSGLFDLMLIITMVFLVFNFLKLKKGTSKRWQIITMLCAFVVNIIATFVLWVAYEDFPTVVAAILWVFYSLLVMYSCLVLRDWKKASVEELN